MTTPLGTNTVSSISRRHILPNVMDMAYGTNALFFRFNKNNKKQVAGGMHVELPFIHSKLTNAGSYEGYDTWNVAPEDVIKNGAWDIKQYYTTITIDGRTLARCNTAEAVVNVLTTHWDLARMTLADKLGDGLYSDCVTNTKEIDGLKGAVDDGGVATSYAGLVRASNTFLNAYDDSSTSTLTASAVNSAMMQATVGGYAPTIILSRVEQYNRIWAILQAQQHLNVGTGATDEVLGQAGFTNLKINNIPWVLDDKVFDGPNTTNSAILLLNENFLELLTFFNTDFEMVDFVKPHNQDAMVGALKWYGNLICTNPGLQAKLTNISA